MDLNGKMKAKYKGHNDRHHDDDRLRVHFEWGHHDETLHLPLVQLALLRQDGDGDERRYHIICGHEAAVNHNLNQNLNSYRMGSAESAIRKLRFRRYFEALFTMLDDDGDGSLSGEQIYDFFLSSALKTEILRTIWDQSVGDNCPTMNVEQFMLAMQLIASHQRREYDDDDQHRLSRRPLAAGIAMMEYPLNPFDILLFVDSENERMSSSTKYTPPHHGHPPNGHSPYRMETDDEAMEYVINEPQHRLTSNENGGFYNNAHRLTAEQLLILRGSSRTKTPETQSKTTAITLSKLNRKCDEFRRFYGAMSMQFGSKQEVYYEKLAEFEYNDIEKMMDLDRETLTEEFGMTPQHAMVLMTEIERFAANYAVFKKWLIQQLQMKKYAVKFRNEGILTFSIFTQRVQAVADLIPILGQHNANDAHIIFNALPNNIEEL